MRVLRQIIFTMEQSGSHYKTSGSGLHKESGSYGNSKSGSYGNSENILYVNSESNKSSKSKSNKSSTAESNKNSQSESNKSSKSDLNRDPGYPEKSRGRLHRKAQAFSSEFLLAYFIFLMVLSIAFYMWDSTILDITQSEKIYGIEETCNDISEKLLRTQGNPKNWTSSNVLSVGLADENRILNPDKILNFVSMMNESGYEDNAYLMGAGKYDFYFNLTNLAGNSIIINNKICVAGKIPTNDTEYIMTVRRTAILNNEIVRVRVTLFDGGGKFPVL